MNIILFDDPSLRVDLLPFTYTRPIADIRIGILTICEKWKKITGHKTSFLTEGYLESDFPSHFSSDNYYINGALCPTEDVLSAIISLGNGQVLLKEGHLLAFRSSKKFTILELAALSHAYTNDFKGEVHLLNHIWQIFQWNGEEIRSDFELLTANRESAAIEDPYTKIYNLDNVFVEEGASIKCAIINAEDGPVYIGKNSQVMEGAIIRGPFGMGEGSILNMGAKIRPDTSLGPYCKVGGEVSNVVFFGNSNKSHDGFLGNSVIGEWCNLGAGTNASNLKNTYSNVEVWNFDKEGSVNIGFQFCGLLMGDHSKCGINTMFNTGTVVGVCANIFGEGFPQNFVPSFAWGGAGGFSTYKFDKVLKTIALVFSRRKKTLSQTEKEILMEVYERSAKFRVWEKKQ